VKGLTVRLAKLADRALHLDLREQDDREFLQLFSIIINRSILHMTNIRDAGLAERRKVRRLKEKILEDARRLVQSYRIWRRKTQGLTADQFRDALHDLAGECLDLFMGAAY
jgi:hypothetical protein